ncbi:sugar O-acyltransferase (sialic acid O-acetyltransferase NeuD family) [Litorimonas taeanensis]|uniref:Sugar O-acyltransferase (Sialic acid O-acetyltransferase NeuD family) n=1 Tax=Litorimonas taeanensis TaxID=568099 RepID=A0A420WMJ7_9PROT|nr:sugar O-acyltransferase [Litorimonas taeanensis]RKQ72209.1 sugar O-acyltransferase (sialic acid O-acetyltransferase NeuD family) [Litorimonas taeanensis]
MKIAIFGSSGFAREVADLCHDIGYTDMVLVDGSNDADTVAGLKVLDDSHISTLASSGYDFVIAIGSPQIRRKIASQYPDLNFPNLIHPTVSFGRGQRERLEASRGNIFCAGCRLSNTIDIGDFCTFNMNVLIGHDVEIQNYVSVMSTTVISGNVTIGDNVYIGSGALITNGKLHKKLTIEKDAFIGIGSVVLRRIREGHKVFGNPAKKI